MKGQAYKRVQKVRYNLVTIREQMNVIIMVEHEKFFFNRTTMGLETKLRCE